MDKDGRNDVADVLCRAGREVAGKNLTWGTAGNISARISADSVLISASGTALGHLRPSDLCVLALDGSPPMGGGAPSLETPMHTAIYRAHPWVNAILHASPFYATLAASSDIDLDPALAIDPAYYVRAVARVPFYPPGTAALAEAVTGACSRASVLLLGNHGALAVGTAISEVVTRIEALELLAHMAILGRLGVPLRPLNVTQVRDLLHSVAASGKV